MPSLSERLSSALESRDRRLIRRRLPEPSSASLPEIDFTTNDYLSLSTSPTLQKAVLTALSSAPNILGSGGSRLLVPAQPHAELETRLCRFFDAEAALLFNSGFDANVGFFSAVPQPGDFILYDAHIHASVHDGMRLSRLSPDSLLSFSHNSVPALRQTLSKLFRDHEDLKKGQTSVFIAVESLYSMDGTIAPLTQIVECVEEMLPSGNGYIIVDEAHATGIYGPKGRGLVADLGLEKRVFARLHTFGKALASSGAALLTSKLVKDYLLNYARSLIYTTTLTYANIIAVNCSFDMLEDGTTEALSAHLLSLSTYVVDLLREKLRKYPSSLLSLPEHLADASSPSESTQPVDSSPLLPWQTDPEIRDDIPSRRKELQQNVTANPVSLPSPIIPILTPEPRALSSFLLSYTSPSTPSSASSQSPLTLSRTIPLHTKPIYPPTVPKGTSRVRICLHASHTHSDVELLVEGIVAWAEKRMGEERKGRMRWEGVVREVGVDTWMAAKL